jgi:hypothetical protein
LADARAYKALGLQELSMLTITDQAQQLFAEMNRFADTLREVAAG